MTAAVSHLDRLVSSLVREGYALYPYTPGAAKNSTPTPFGILYPLAYAAREPTTFDHLQVECLLHAPSVAELFATARFLQASGPRHQAVERRVDLPPVWLAALTDRPAAIDFAFDDGASDHGEASAGGEGIAGRLQLDAEFLEPGTWRVRLQVENTTALDADAARDLDRAAALRLSLLSTHALLRVSEGRFVSPLERTGPLGEAVAACRNVNTWPVLATPEDDAVLGAAIFLPDHPQVAPESRLDLFDSTEIEEALLLHVHALSDGEREAIGEQDPAVREMIERALSTTPQDILALHGRLRIAEAPEGDSDD
ncbi:MAG TPA: hypothetical protein VN783_13265 [Thermoanaerobaculia bacterium]|nr:hypothetical protein [Thermoanaerobaculia bacterium]